MISLFFPLVLVSIEQLYQSLKTGLTTVPNILNFVKNTPLKIHIIFSARFSVFHNVGKLGVFWVIWSSYGIQRNTTEEININKHSKQNTTQHTSQSMDLKNSWSLMSWIPFSPTPSENEFQRVRKHISRIVCAQEHIHIHLKEGYSKKEGSLSLSLNEHLNQNWKFNKVWQGGSSRSDIFLESILKPCVT